jgi:hypothetical protein
MRLTKLAHKCIHVCLHIKKQTYNFTFIIKISCTTIENNMGLNSNFVVIIVCLFFCDAEDEPQGLAR